MSREYFNLNRWFIVAWLLGTIIVFSLLIATHGRLWRINYNAKMTEFSVCSGLDSNGVPIRVTRPITVEAKEIDICGYLEGNGPNIPLGFFLQYNNGETIVNPLSGRYQPGYIIARFVAPPAGFKTGRYLVFVYSGRHKLASTEFTIEKL